MKGVGGGHRILVFDTFSRYSSVYGVKPWRVEVTPKMIPHLRPSFR